jgi:hypothetical protein
MRALTLRGTFEEMRYVSNYGEEGVGRVPVTVRAERSWIFSQSSCAGGRGAKAMFVKRRKSERDERLWKTV